jgi:hypothetical protein
MSSKNGKSGNRSTGLGKKQVDKKTTSKKKSDNKSVYVRDDLPRQTRARSKDNVFSSLYVFFNLRNTQIIKTSSNK